MFTKYKSVKLSKHAKQRFKERLNINVDHVNELKLDINAFDVEPFYNTDGTYKDYVAINVNDVTTLLPIDPTSGVVLTVLPEYFDGMEKDKQPKWMKDKFAQANMFFY